MSEYRSIDLYLQDILDSIAAINVFVKDHSLDTFSSNRMVFSATIRELQIIGEAVSKLPLSIKRKHAKVPWRDIKDFRNILVHVYFGIDDETVWDVIQNELSILQSEIVEIARESGFKPKYL